MHGQPDWLETVEHSHSMVEFNYYVAYAYSKLLVLDHWPIQTRSDLSHSGVETATKKSGGIHNYHTASKNYI